MRAARALDEARFRDLFFVQRDRAGTLAPTPAILPD